MMTLSIPTQYVVKVAQGLRKHLGAGDRKM
jgi:hypothetical protein